MSCADSPMGLIAVGIVIGVVCLVFASGAVTAAEYELDVHDAIDVPRQIVTIENEEYEITATADVDTNETVTVDATVSDETAFRIDLYDSNEQVVDFERGNGSESVSFDTNGLDPGSYALVLVVDGTHRDVFPVVVSGYDMTATYATEVESGESFDVDIDVTNTTGDDPPTTVRAIVWNDNETYESTAKLESGTYTATFTDVDSGEYDVHTITQHDEEVRDELEVVGIEPSGMVTVSESSDTGTGGVQNGNDQNSVDQNDTTNETGTESPPVESGLEDPNNESTISSTNEEAGDSNESQSTDTQETDGNSDSKPDGVLMPTENETGDKGNDDDAVPSDVITILATVVLSFGLSERVRTAIHRAID